VDLLYILVSEKISLGLAYTYDIILICAIRRQIYLTTKDLASKVSQ